MNNKASLDISELKAIKAKIRTMNSRLQKEQIEQASPYSKGITSYIRSCDELRLYCTLRLKESVLTRGTLIADIDPALWISSENATNIELMSKGGSPLNYVLKQHMGNEIVCLYSDKSQAIKRFATSCGYVIK